ncbi:MAG: glycosyltransferase [Bacteroidales bacterium]|nr:glycosyltransferase [Bacteroidales bacterium]
MKISIVIPIYNVEQYLEQCLSSIQAQKYDDLEVICVNDGSTDDSRKILTEWATHFPQMRIIDRENGGLSAARNTGLKAAKGDYIVFIDSDDWVEPTMLSRISEEVKGEDMICFACRKSDYGATDALVPEQSDGWTYYNQHALEHRIIPFVCVWQRYYRREFLIENRLHFREGILHEDNEFTPRACLHAKSIKVIPDVLYNYRVRPGSIMTTRGLRSKESLITIGNELSELFSNENGIDKTIVYQALTQCYQMAFVNNTHEEDQYLLPLVNWQCYRRVSRTKTRHRLQYLALRISPTLFRFINQR